MGAGAWTGTSPLLAIEIATTTTTEMKEQNNPNNTLAKLE